MMYLIPDIFFLSCCFFLLGIGYSGSVTRDRLLGIGYMVKELRVRILYD